MHNEDAIYPSKVPVNMSLTDGKEFTNDLLGNILYELGKPLKQRLDEKTRPRNTPIEDTLCIYNKGNAVSINNTNTQIGGLGANITCIPDNSIIAMWSNDIQLCGHAKFIPNQPHTAIDLNFGPLNMAFAPPIEEDPRPTPTLAIVAVDTEDVGYSNIPTPASEEISCTISIIDQLLMQEQKLTRKINRQQECMSSVYKGITTGTNVKVSDAKAEEAELNISIPVYVIIPDHIHAGPGGPVAEWITGNNCAAAVRGIKYEYLFGYNRMNDIITSKQVRTEKEIKI